MSGRGIRIDLEGRDGVGKTVQVPLVAESLRQQLNVSVLETREPGGTELGASLRHLLLESDTDVAPRAQLLLFAADNAQHANDVVLPALARGEWVLSDRGMGSALAYQGHGNGWDTAVVNRIYGWAVDDSVASVTVLLDCPDDVITERRSKHAESADNIERMPSEFHKAVRDGYRKIAENDPTWCTVDASGSVPEVTERIVAAVLVAAAGKFDPPDHSNG